MVEFQVTNLMIATVKGRSRTFDGALQAGESGPLNAPGTVRVASLDTDDAKPDERLLSSDTFDAATDPAISVTSREIRPRDAGELTVTGRLTINGVTRSIELTGTVQGVARDRGEDERVAFELRGALDRRDLGLTGDTALETVAALVAREVQFELDISAIKLTGDATALTGGQARPAVLSAASAPATPTGPSPWFG